MSAHYGPDESWPRHQKSWWNEVLAEARAAGWTLNYIDAPHKFGVVSCPSKDDATRHNFMVDKTARGAETKSKEARKLVRGCRHGSTLVGSKVRARQEECERLLQEAERLISIADAGLTLAEAQAAAWADLERLETQLETPRQTWLRSCGRSKRKRCRLSMTPTIPPSQMRSRPHWMTPHLP